MAAHLRPLRRCSEYECGKPATQQLFNTWNAPMGTFCDKHAGPALKRFERDNPDQVAKS